MIKAFIFLVVEIVKAMLLKIAFKQVLQRFIERAFIWAGDNLVKMTTNTLDDETWRDIRQSLKGKKLEVVEAHKRPLDRVIDEWDVD